MTNHVFNSESSEDLSYLYSEDNNDRSKKSYKRKQKGGEDDKKSGSSEDRPNGGFPPIFIINVKEKESEQSKTRQLAAPGKGKVTVSIKDILKSKK